MNSSSVLWTPRFLLRSVKVSRRLFCFVLDLASYTAFVWRWMCVSWYGVNMCWFIMFSTMCIRVRVCLCIIADCGWAYMPQWLVVYVWWFHECTLVTKAIAVLCLYWFSIASVVRFIVLVLVPFISFAFLQTNFRMWYDRWWPLWWSRNRSKKEFR